MPIPPFSNGTTPSATASVKGKVQLAGDLGGTAASPQVVATHLSAALPVSQGGSGAATLTGVLKGNGTSAFTAASAGTDYLTPSGNGSALTGITQSQITGLTTASSPTFAGLNLGTGAINTVGNIELDPSAARDITVGRSASTTGSNLTVQAGGAQSGGTNLAGGNLVLSSAISTGSSRSSILFATAPSGSSGTSDNNPANVAAMFSPTSGIVIFSLATTSLSTTGLLSSSTNTLAMSGQGAAIIQQYRHTTSNTAGNPMTLTAGGATSGATDKSGGDLKLVGGLSTGQGGSNVRIQTMTRALSTGTSDNTATDRIIAQSPKSVTNNSATTVSTLTIASGSTVSGTLNYSVEVTDGTDFQTEAGVIAYSETNKGGVVANNTVTKIGSNQSVTAGTLAVTWTLTTGGLIQVNANSSLTPSTGYPRVTFVLHNTTQQAVAIS